MTISDLEVDLRNGQMGVYASRSYESGERVIHVRGDERRVSSRYSIQIGVERHLHPDGPDVSWKYLNHSCRPNLIYDPASRSFIACQAIAGAEELTFNYLTTEWDMAESFVCECGDPACFGRIAGFKHLDQVSKAQLLNEALPHIRSLHEASLKGRDDHPPDDS